MMEIHFFSSNIHYGLILMQTSVKWYCNVAF